MADKWVRTPKGTLVSLDRIEQITVTDHEGGFAVVGWRVASGDGDDSCFVLFSHADRKVCEEWLDEFAKRLNVADPVVLWRDCPQCCGRGALPIGPDGADETCSFCAGERKLSLETYESTMREWGLKP